MKFWTQNLSTRSNYFILSANANRNSKNRWESRYCCFEIKSQTPDPPTVTPVLFSYPNGSKICLDDLKQNYDSNLKKSYIQNLYQHFHLISFPNSDKIFRLPYPWPSFDFQKSWPETSDYLEISSAWMEQSWFFWLLRWSHLYRVYRALNPR